MGPRGKQPKDPRMGDYDMARFIWVEIRPWVPNFPSPSIQPWKKVQPCPQQAGQQSPVSRVSILH